MTEEQRASEYRRMMAARSRNKAARERALAGSKAAQQEVLANWQPVIDWQEERNANDGGREVIEESGQIFNINPGVE